MILHRLFVGVGFIILGSIFLFFVHDKSPAIVNFGFPVVIIASGVVCILTFVVGILYGNPEGKEPK